MTEHKHTITNSGYVMKKKNHSGSFSEDFFFFFFFWCIPFILKVFIDFVTILLLFYVLFCFFFFPQGMWDLCSSTRGRINTPYKEGKILSIGLQESTTMAVFNL